MATEFRVARHAWAGNVYETVGETYDWYPRFKRLLDLVICIGILPPVMLLIAIIAIAVRIDSPGTPFFVQERVGKGHRRFRMFKFRTMTNGYNDEQDRNFMKAYVAGRIDTDDQNQNSVFKPISKNHVTRLGKFLRKSSLDELPQIFNILIGEMSLIGPRPNTVWEVDEYRDWHRERLDVLPGITGLAQVNGRSEITFDEIARYDIRYVRNLSLSLDIWILIQTLWTVLTGKGAG